MWFLYALLSALCATIVALLAKFNCKTVDIYVVTTIKAFLMASTILLVTLCLKSFNSFSIIDLSYKDWLILLATGLFGGLGWLFYFLALNCGSVSNVVAIDRLSIIFVMLLSFIFLSEQLSIIKCLGGLVMVGGAYLIIYF